MLYSMKVRKIGALRSARIEYEYQQIRNAAHIRANNQFSIKDFNSIEDLNKYLTKDSKC